MTPEKLGRMTRENVEYWLLHEMHKRAQDVDAGLIRQALARIAPVTEEDADARRGPGSGVADVNDCRRLYPRRQHLARGV